MFMLKHIKFYTDWSFTYLIDIRAAGLGPLGAKTLTSGPLQQRLAPLTLFALLTVLSHTAQYLKVSLLIIMFPKARAAAVKILYMCIGKYKNVRINKLLPIPSHYWVRSAWKSYSPKIFGEFRVKRRKFLFPLLKLLIQTFAAAVKSERKREHG